MAMNSDSDQSNRTYTISHKLFEAAERAPKDSATRRGLLNASEKQEIKQERGE